MVGYICDRCKKTYDWYETVYNKPEFQDWANRREYYGREEGKNSPYEESIECNYNTNCLEFKLFEPINTNMGTNNGVLTGKVTDAEETNNELIMLCPDCMRAFMKEFLGWTRVSPD